MSYSSINIELFDSEKRKKVEIYNLMLYADSNSNRTFKPSRRIKKGVH